MLEGDTDRGSGAGGSGISVSYDRCAAVCSDYGGLCLLWSGVGGGGQRAGCAGVYGARYLRDRHSASADEYRSHSWQSMRSGRKQPCGKGSAIKGGQREGDANVLELRMTYRVQNVTGVYLPRITFLQKVCVRAWSRERRNISCRWKHRRKREGKTVYVAATGKVYHTDPYCTHLKLSIREVGARMVGQLRNKSGEKYHACERCHAGSAGSVYITGEGNRYHGSLSCSGLKRTVEEVLQEDCDLRPCSKCAEPYLYVE